MNSKFITDSHCFACGAENRSGLQLRIIETHDGVTAQFKPALWLQGYKEIVHGGIIATVLDEMAVWAAYKKGYKSVTAELSVRIKKPMKIGDEYQALGKVVYMKHKLIQAEAEIRNKKEEIIATGQVRLIRIDED